MAVTRCENGHYFDDLKHPECPHCKDGLPKKTRSGASEQRTVFGASSPAVADAALKQRIHIDLGGAKNAADERTVGVFRVSGGHDPVVGWLVCTEGRERGRDFRLHAGRNYVGRAIKSDIALTDDESVSRENHCSVIFEPKSGDFYLVNGLGEGTEHNGERLSESRKLASGDEIALGGSKFTFIPFCGEGRSW